MSQALTNAAAIAWRTAATEPRELMLTGAQEGGSAAWTPFILWQSLRACLDEPEFQGVFLQQRPTCRGQTFLQH